VKEKEVVGGRREGRRRDQIPVTKEAMKSDRRREEEFLEEK